MNRGPERDGVPPLAETVLRALVPEPDLCEELLGDLHEDRAEALASGSRVGRRLWYWSAILAFAARYRAGTAFGGPGAARRSSMGRGEWMGGRRMDTRETLAAGARNLRLAARSLARRPGFGALAVLTLALGIGANTAIFSVIHGSLLRPLAFHEPHRLVYLSDGHEDFGGAGINMSLGNLEDLRAASSLLESSAMFTFGSVNLSTDERPARALALTTSSELLGVLGLAPALGRDFVLEDDRAGAEAVAILTDRFWRVQFGADASIVGRTVIIDAAPVRVVGVAPPEFAFPSDPQLLLTLQHVGVELSHIHRNYNAVGRLAPGAEIEPLRAELQGIFEGLVRAHPEANDGWFTWAEPMSAWVTGSNRSSLVLLGGSVLLVLLIACVNVANLLLVRAETRGRELAVRFALGAGRTGLLAHFLSEGLVLSVLGGVLGVAVAYGGVDLLVAVYGDSLARADQIGINGTVLGFGLAVSLLVGLAVGAVPLVRARAQDLAEGLKEGARGASVRSSRLGRALVVTEVALALVIVAGAGLLMNSMWHLQRQDLGLTDLDRVLTFRLALPPAAYEDDGEVEAFHAGLLTDLGQIPGVEAVGLVSRRPLLGGNNRHVAVFGDPDRSANFVSIRAVTEDYFEAAGVRLVAGRWLSAADYADGLASTLINETLARRLFSGEDPVGQRLDLGWNEDGVRIVGVVTDIAGFSPNRPAPPAFYYPFAATAPRRAFGALVRTAGDPAALVPSIRRSVERLDPALPLHSVVTLEEISQMRLGRNRFAMSLFAVFAGLALVLGAVGIYGVMSVSVARRAREMGVRIALGASRPSVFRLVLADSARITIPGVLIGVVIALASARLLDNLLFGVSALDPATYAAVAVTLLATALLATWIPARRATRVEPLESIRSE